MHIPAYMDEVTLFFSCRPCTPRPGIQDRSCSVVKVRRGTDHLIATALPDITRSSSRRLRLGQPQHTPRHLEG